MDGDGGAPTALTDEQHAWASQFCGVDTKGGSSGGDGADNAGGTAIGGASDAPSSDGDQGPTGSQNAGTDEQPPEEEGVPDPDGQSGDQGQDGGPQSYGTGPQPGDDDQEPEQGICPDEDDSDDDGEEPAPYGRSDDQGQEGGSQGGYPDDTSTYGGGGESGGGGSGGTYGDAGGDNGDPVDDTDDTGAQVSGKLHACESGASSARIRYEVSADYGKYLNKIVVRITVTNNIESDTKTFPKTMDAPVKTFSEIVTITNKTTPWVRATMSATITHLDGSQASTPAVSVGCGARGG